MLLGFIGLGCGVPARRNPELGRKCATRRAVAVARSYRSPCAHTLGADHALNEVEPRQAIKRHGYLPGDVSPRDELDLQHVAHSSTLCIHAVTSRAVTGTPGSRGFAVVSDGSKASLLVSASRTFASISAGSRLRSVCNCARTAKST